MREFVLETAAGNCLSDEEIAGYIDGTLGQEDRERAMGHLAECERCLEIYGEAVLFLQESEPAYTESNIIRGRFPRAVYEWLPWAAAAVLLLAVGVGAGYLGYSFYYIPPHIMTAEVVEPFQGTPEVIKNLYKSRVLRSGNQLEVEFFSQSFLVGALWVDLRLISEAEKLTEEDAERAAAILQKVGAILDAIGPMQEEVERLKRQAKQAESVAGLRRASLEILQQEQEMGDWVLDPNYLAFGKWTAAGRLAAVLEKPEFFERRSNRRFLWFLLHDEQMTEEMKISKEVRPILLEIERLWDRDLSENDYDALGEKFTSILVFYDRLANPL